MLGLLRNILRLLHLRCLHPPLPLLRSARGDGVLPGAPPRSPGVSPMLIV